MRNDFHLTRHDRTHRQRKEFYVKSLEKDVARYDYADPTSRSIEAQGLLVFHQDFAKHSPSSRKRKPHYFERI
jgi:hypothetical protein